MSKEIFQRIQSILPPYPFNKFFKISFVSPEQIQSQIQKYNPEFIKKLQQLAPIRFDHPFYGEQIIINDLYSLCKYCFVFQVSQSDIVINLKNEEIPYYLFSDSQQLNIQENQEIIFTFYDITNFLLYDFFRNLQKAMFMFPAYFTENVNIQIDIFCVHENNEHEVTFQFILKNQIIVSVSEQTIHNYERDVLKFDVRFLYDFLKINFMDD